MAVSRDTVNGLLVYGRDAPLGVLIVGERRHAPVQNALGLFLPRGIPLGVLQNIHSQCVCVDLGIGVGGCGDVLEEGPPCKFIQKGGHWSTKPLTGEYEVVGPYGDLQANVHTNLPPGYADFYISQSQTDSARTAAHATCEALAKVGTPCPPKVSPTSLNFGTVTVGTTSAAQTVTMTNLASSAINFSSIAIVGTNHGDFSIASNTCRASLAGGGSCAIGVTFTPSATGARVAELRFTDNGGGARRPFRLRALGSKAD